MRSSFHRVIMQRTGVRVIKVIRVIRVIRAIRDGSTGHTAPQRGYKCISSVSLASPFIVSLT